MKCDLECKTIGSRWTTSFALLAVAYVLLSVQGAMLALGVWVFPTRLIGLLCQLFCNLYFCSALLTATIFRYDTKGSLAALSLSPSTITFVDGVAVPDTSDGSMTYADDGERI